MNITSLLITFAGIIIIIALFIMSRVARSEIPTKHVSKIPDIKDENGGKFTSVLDDIPATDGSAPKATVIEEIDENIQQEVEKQDPAVTTITTSKAASSPQKVTEAQHILFISGNDQEGLDGNLVLQALKVNGLVLGEMNIYHYVVNLENETGMASLFRVANGMEPWTLLDSDLVDQKLAGLSIVLQTPSRIDDEKAMRTFITTSENLCKAINGTLKNHEQQLLTLDNKQNLIASIKK